MFTFFKTYVITYWYINVQILNDVIIHSTLLLSHYAKRIRNYLYHGFRDVGPFRRVAVSIYHDTALDMLLCSENISPYHPDYKFPMIWSQGSSPSLSILKDSKSSLVVYVNKDVVINHELLKKPRSLLSMYEWHNNMLHDYFLIKRSAVFY